LEFHFRRFEVILYKVAETSRKIHYTSHDDDDDDDNNKYIIYINIKILQ